MSDKSEEKARVRYESDKEAKAAQRKRDDERRAEAGDPKAVEKVERGREPLETRVAKIWARVQEETEAERHERDIKQREGAKEPGTAMHEASKVAQRERRRQLEEDEDGESPEADDETD